MKTYTKIIHSAVLASCLLTGFTVLSSGCAGSTTKASTGEFIDDSVITTKVKAALLKNDSTPGTDIKVETFKGVVQLSGFVDTLFQKTRAEEVSRGIDGVQNVVNNITVK